MSLLEGLKDRAEGAEVYEIQSDTSLVNFKSAELETAKSIQSMGRALRIIKNGRVGYSVSSDLYADSELIKSALESAKFGDEARFRFQEPTQVSEVATYDPKVAEIDHGDLISMGKGMIQTMRDFDPDLEIDASVVKRHEEIKINNSSGHQVSEKRSSFGISLSVEKVKEGDILSLWQSENSRGLTKADPDRVANSLMEKLQWAEKIAPPVAKKMPVLFTPRGVAVLLLPLWLGLNGKSVYLETSPLKDKVGEEVFAHCLSLIDDGTVDYASRSFKFDDEGVPTSRKYLVKEGNLQQFIYDLKTAGMAGEKPTGNGLKSGITGSGDFRSSPASSPTSTLISKGEESLQDMLSKIDEGILVDRVLGLGQGNITSGEFSNNVAVGFKIEKGEIIGRVKNTMIAGNVYDLLKDKVLAIGDQAEWAFGGAFKSPPILIDGVNVVAK